MAEIINPAAIGDPDQVPIVKLDEDVIESMVRLGLICKCGGMNGWHMAACPSASDKVLDDEDPTSSDEPTPPECSDG